MEFSEVSVFDAIMNSNTASRSVDDVVANATIVGPVHFMEGADLRRVHLITPNKEKPTYTVLNIADVLKGKTSDNLVIRPGEIIYVPSHIDVRINKFLARLVAPATMLNSTDSVYSDTYSRMKGRVDNSLISTMVK